MFTPFRLFSILACTALILGGAFNRADAISYNGSSSFILPTPSYTGWITLTGGHNGVLGSDVCAGSAEAFFHSYYRIYCSVGASDSSSLFGRYATIVPSNYMASGTYVIDRFLLRNQSSVDITLRIALISTGSQSWAIQYSLLDTGLNVLDSKITHFVSSRTGNGLVPSTFVLGYSFFFSAFKNLVGSNEFSLSQYSVTLYNTASGEVLNFQDVGPNLVFGTNFYTQQRFLAPGTEYIGTNYFHFMPAYADVAMTGTLDKNRSFRLKQSPIPTPNLPDWFGATSVSIGGTGTTDTAGYYDDCESFLDVGCYIIGIGNMISDLIPDWILNPTLLFPTVDWSGYSSSCSGSSMTGVTLTGGVSSLSIVQNFANAIVLLNPIPPDDGQVMCTLFGVETMEYQRIIPEHNFFSEYGGASMPSYLLGDGRLIFGQTIVDIAVIILFSLLIFYKKHD